MYIIELVNKSNIKLIKYNNLHEVYHYEMQGKFNKKLYIDKKFYMIKHNKEPIFVGGINKVKNNYILDGLMFNNSKHHIITIVRIIRNYLKNLPIEILMNCIVISVRKDIQFARLIGMKYLNDGVDVNNRQISFYGYN